MTESTQEEQKHPGGRPLKFESVEDLEVRIKLLFDDCDKREDTRQWSREEIITIDGNQT